MATDYTVGTKLSGFVTAEDNPPPRDFGHCRWFNGKDACSHPVVRFDQEVLKHADGRPAVDGDDCCNFFSPRRKGSN